MEDPRDGIVLKTLGLILAPVAVPGGYIGQYLELRYRIDGTYAFCLGCLISAGFIAFILFLMWRRSQRNG